MNKVEFMEKVEYLLSDLPEEETRDALEYYRDYLEEAGDAADEVIRGFGSPERIASIIRADIRGDMPDGGEFTEAGYDDRRFREPGYQMVEQTAGKEKKNGTGARDVLKVVLLVLFALVCLPAAAVTVVILLKLLPGMLVVLLTLLLGIPVLSVAGIVLGLFMSVAGFILLFAHPLIGAVLLGTGLILFAVALACLVLTVWFYGRCVPRLVTFCVNGSKKWFHGKERAV